MRSGNFYTILEGMACYTGQLLDPSTNALFGLPANKIVLGLCMGAVGLQVLPILHENIQVADDFLSINVYK